MSASKPAGPRPIFVIGFAAGVVLIGACFWAPSVNVLWQFPLGALLLVTSLGKMVSR